MTDFATEAAAAATRLLEDFVAVTNEQPKQGILYHYTDAAGLLGILESNCFRGTDARFMNDPLELSHGIQILRGSCSGEFGQRFPTTSRLLMETAEMRELLNEETAYLASFSTDDDQLSQWRAYASDGCGYAIGIDPTKRLVALPRKLGSAARWFRVRYSEREQRELFERILGPIAEVIEKFSGTPEFRDDVALALLDGPVSLVTAGMKQSGFHEESEWRVCTPWKTRRDSLRFRASKKGVVPYAEFSTHDESPLPIVDLVLGPRIGARGVAAAEELLAYKGYRAFVLFEGAEARLVPNTVRVRRSKIQYE